jgi:hypothetical protein
VFGKRGDIQEDWKGSLMQESLYFRWEGQYIRENWHTCGLWNTEHRDLRVPAQYAHEWYGDVAVYHPDGKI